MISVALVDDQGLIRAGLRALIDGEDDMVVVGEAADGAEGVELVRRRRPDVVLMDISMPVLDGIEATRLITELIPAPCVLMLTGSNSKYDVDRSREAGASGYITKDRIAAELVEAIVEVAAR
jgi:DNA-binding NarL/FixJ family response regulator